MTEQDPIFQLFHRYNKLVRRGLVKPLTCPSCDGQYSYGYGEDDILVLNCYRCGSSKSPGVDTLGNVRAVVMEHFE